MAEVHLSAPPPGPRCPVCGVVCINLYETLMGWRHVHLDKHGAWVERVCWAPARAASTASEGRNG